MQGKGKLTGVAPAELQLLQQQQQAIKLSSSSSQSSISNTVALASFLRQPA
jgi:hypothetical protein